MRASMQLFYPVLGYKFGTVCLDLLRSLLLVYSSVYLISSLLGGHVLMPLFRCWHQPRRRATSSSFYCALCRTTKNVSSYVTKQSVRARLSIITITRSNLRDVARVASVAGIFFPATVNACRFTEAGVFYFLRRALLPATVNRFTVAGVLRRPPRKIAYFSRRAS